jgi:hypothetical protein
MKTVKILKLWSLLHWQGSAELQPVTRIPLRQWCVHCLRRPTRHICLCALRIAPVGMTSWWRCCKACTYDTDVAGSAELRHGQPEEWLPTEMAKSSWRWLGRRSPERDTCNTDILLGRVPTTVVLDMRQLWFALRTKCITVTQLPRLGNICTRIQLASEFLATVILFALCHSTCRMILMVPTHKLACWCACKV